MYARRKYKCSITFIARLHRRVDRLPVHAQFPSGRSAVGNKKRRRAAIGSCPEYNRARGL